MQRNVPAAEDSAHPYSALKAGLAHCVGVPTYHFERDSAARVEGKEEEEEEEEEEEAEEEEAEEEEEEEEEEATETRRRWWSMCTGALQARQSS